MLLQFYYFLHYNFRRPVVKAMANNQRGSGIQRPNGATQSKICQFKLVLLGESAVGKSSLVLRFVKGQFHEYQESTIGAAFLTQTVHIDDTAVKFEIWVSCLEVSSAFNF